MNFPIILRRTSAGLLLVGTALAQGSTDTFPYPICLGRDDAGVVLSDSDLLHVAVRCTRADSEIRIQRKERDNLGSRFDPSERAFSTSFRVTAVAGHKAGDEIYVAGVKDSGATVVERWSFPSAEGRIVAARVPGVVPVLLSGPSQPPITWVTGTRGSPLFEDPFLVPYAPPVHRGAINRPVRTVIYDPDTNVGHIRNMVVDPEGRYLIFQLHSTAELYRWDLNALSFPVQAASAFADPVLTSTQAAELTLRARNDVRMTPFDHPTDGRILLFALTGTIYGATTEAKAALKDADNDGVWETTETWSTNQWLQSGYGEELVPAIPH